MRFGKCVLFPHPTVPLEVQSKKVEFQIILNLSLEDTQKKLDKALKRNMGTQAQPAPIAPKTATNDLTVEEPISDTDEPIEE